MVIETSLGPGARVVLPEAPLVQMALRSALMRRDMSAGDRITQTLFDPMSQREVEIDITYRGEDTIELMGQEGIEAHHFEERSMGYTNHVYVNALGEVLLEELPGGIVVMREPEAEAVAPVDDGPVEGIEALDGAQGDWLRRLVKPKLRTPSEEGP